MKYEITSTIVAIALALAPATSHAARKRQKSFREQESSQLAELRAAASRERCVGFSKRVVDLVNEHARAALKSANGSKSYDEAFSNDVVAPSYGKLSHTSVHDGKPSYPLQAARALSDLNDYYGRELRDVPIPGLKPDTSVPGALATHTQLCRSITA